MTRHHLAVLAVLLASLTAQAQAPLLLGYQGRLLKVDGTPEPGPVQMRFALYPTDTGGAPAWQETQSVVLTDGYYSTYIGRATTLPASLFEASTQWLELSTKTAADVDFKPMNPRQRVGSVAYALMCRGVKGGAVDATSVSVNGSVVIDGSGRLTSGAGYVAGDGISIDSTTRAISLNATGCASGQVLQYNGSNFVCASVSASGGSVTSITAGAGLTGGTITSAGTIGVNFGNSAGTVAAGNDARFGKATSLQGGAVSSAMPALNQYLAWNGSEWAPTSPSAAVSAVTAGAGLTGGTITSTGTLAVNFGTMAGTVAAGNDARFGNAVALQGNAVAAVTPASSQYLKWDGMAWAPAAAVSAVTAGTGLTGGTISSAGTIGLANGGVGTAQLADGAVTPAKLAGSGCTANQVLQWNGTSWACATVGNGTAAPPLVANFEFEETGTTFNDTSGLANNATFVSGLTAGAVGHTGSGANFSGGVATVAAGNTIPDSPQVSVEAWIWPQSVSATDQRIIVAKAGAWSLRYLTGAGVSDIDFTITGRATSPSCTVATVSAGIPTTGWTHVSALYDGLKVALYINGQLSVRAPCQKGAMVPNAGSVLSFGGPPTGAGNRYLGFLDSVRIRSVAIVPVVSDFPDNPFPGSVILSRDQMNQINAWTGRPYQKWVLCYRKTRDGATATAFHAACDYRGPTVSVFRTANRILGGYTRLSWNQAGAYGSYDTSAFLFSLTANKRYRHMGYPVSSYPGVIYNAASYGPTFGNGHDLYVNASMDIGYCNFPYAYNCNQRTAGSPNDACAQELCGVNANTSQGVAANEVEVWFEE